MAKAPKTLSPAEVKAAKKDLVTLLKAQKDNLKPVQADAAAATKALAVAKKEADKAVATAQKAVDAATAKLAKAEAAAAAGTAKLQAKLEALESAAAM